MQLSIAAALAACATVQAFSDSSPFVLFSTAELPELQANPQLQTSNKVIAAAKELLSSCPTDRYILVSQPNVHAADIRDGSSYRCNMPNLCRAVASEATRGRFSVAEVIGQVSGKPLSDYVVKACADKGKVAKVDRVDLAHLPALRETEKRRELLIDNDHELGRLLGTFDGDYTVIMFSDPNEFRAYEPEFVEPVHIDLKRYAEEEEMLAAGLRRRAKGNSTNLPLFEKYQFFTPGIFSGLIALIVMLSILGIGLKALASLEVSYGAFDKENGPAAHKKL